MTDAAHARLVELRRDDPTWHVEGTFDHPDSRKRTSELETDHLGQRAPQGRGVHHNALAPSSFRHEVEKEHFAHTLGTMLDQAARSNRFDHLVIVSGPHFLGLLKNELSAEIQKRVLSTVDKDLNHLSLGDLSHTLRDVVCFPTEPRERRDIHIHPH